MLYEEEIEDTPIRDPSELLACDDIYFSEIPEPGWGAADAIVKCDDIYKFIQRYDLNTQKEILKEFEFYNIPKLVESKKNELVAECIAGQNWYPTKSYKMHAERFEGLASEWTIRRPVTRKAIDEFVSERTDLGKNDYVILDEREEDTKIIAARDVMYQYEDCVRKATLGLMDEIRRTW